MAFLRYYASLKFRMMLLFYGLKNFELILQKGKKKKKNFELILAMEPSTYPKYP